MAFIEHTWQRLSMPVAPASGDTVSLTTSFQPFATNCPIPASAMLAKRSFRAEAWGVTNISGAVLSIQSAVFLGTTQLVASPSISLAILANGFFLWPLLI